jgi:hypothetical protein
MKTKPLKKELLKTRSQQKLDRKPAATGTRTQRRLESHAAAKERERKKEDKQEEIFTG